MDQDPLAGGLRTMLGLGIGPRAWQAQRTDGGAISRESEDKASVRLSLRLEFLSMRSAQCRFSLRGARSFTPLGGFCAVLNSWVSSVG